MDLPKRGSIPILCGKHLSKSMCPQTQEDKDKMRRILYASAIRSIMYAMLYTCPDVLHSLSVASRFQANFREEHWTTVKNILKYLRRTKDMFLIYGDFELKVSGYTDANFQTDKDDYKYQSGFIFLLNRGAVSWKSSK